VLHGLRAGQHLVADVDTPASDLDSLAVLWSATGTIVAVNDDGFQGDDPTDSLLNTTIRTDGDYYLSMSGRGGVDFLPPSLFGSGSGHGVGTEGSYTLNVGLDITDVDVYSLALQVGDVIGASVTGAGTSLSVLDPAQRLVIGSTQDESARPGLSRSDPDDLPGLDGAQLNTAPFGGPGVRTLSPLSAFLTGWIDQVVPTVGENLRNDFAGQGVQVQILNSQDNPDPFGQPNVSRRSLSAVTQLRGLVPLLGLGRDELTVRGRDGAQRPTSAARAAGSLRASAGDRGHRARGPLWL
jgi:hypothetical protein